MTGFDFDIDETGELVINQEEHEINKITDDELRIQLAYTRIKSIAHGWFYDEVGADLEELVGRSIKESTIEYGKEKIIPSWRQIVYGINLYVPLCSHCNIDCSCNSVTVYNHCRYRTRTSPARHFCGKHRRS